MPKPLFDVSNRLIVVTGGLGQLGRQFASILLDQGAIVAVFDTQLDASFIWKRYGELSQHSNISFHKVDVTNRPSIEAAYHEVSERRGIPYGLVNNAALDSPPDAPASENGPFENYSEESFDSIMDVNVKGVVLCCQVIGGAMAEAGRGSIINIASIYGMVSPNQTIYEYRRTPDQQFYKPVAYSVSKSALFNLTRYLATYWAGSGVRVNTLTFAGVFNNQSEEFLKSYLPHVPMGRMANEDEYNGAVVFLLSDAASYMTGSNLIIDGGWTAW
jgi:NAD(P)-dependent dehydrogenase (short-subunit alcohol dehydrogenase family)